MTRTLVIVSVLGIAGLWAFAFFWPKGAPPLPDRYHGVFRLFRYEPPADAGPTTNPFPKGQWHRWQFKADGSYERTVDVSGNYEMMREEGLVWVGERDSLHMKQVSLNRHEAPDETVSYTTRWGSDTEGEFLVLKHARDGYELYFRRLPEG